MADDNSTDISPADLVSHYPTVAQSDSASSNALQEWQQAAPGRSVVLPPTPRNAREAALQERMNQNDIRNARQAHHDALFESEVANRLATDHFNTQIKAQQHNDSAGLQSEMAALPANDPQFEQKATAIAAKYPHAGAEAHGNLAPLWEARKAFMGASAKGGEANYSGPALDAYRSTYQNTGDLSQAHAMGTHIQKNENSINQAVAKGYITPDQIVQHPEGGTDYESTLRLAATNAASRVRTPLNDVEKGLLKQYGVPGSPAYNKMDAAATSGKNPTASAIKDMYWTAMKKGGYQAPAAAPAAAAPAATPPTKSIYTDF